MVTEEHIDGLRSKMRRRKELKGGNMPDRAVRKAVASGDLHRIRHGWFMPNRDWSMLEAEDRHLVEIIAMAGASRSKPLFAYASAGLLLGLPLYRFDRSSVHVICDPGRRSNSRADVVRHVSPANLRDGEEARVGPFRCTGLERTVLDIVRSASRDVGIACADAALRRISKHGRADPRAWRDALLERIDSEPGTAGNRRARELLGLADHRAGSVLESVSRLRLIDLGFEVEAQVRVPAPHGGDYYVDLELVGYDVFCEVDGRVKYTDAEMLAGRTVEQALLDEKRREDWIRGSTRKRVVRWNAEAAETLRSLGGLLVSFGIRPPLYSGAPPEPHSRLTPGNADL